MSGSAVHIVWQDSRDGNEEIYYKRSTDGGLNWGSDLRLTTNISGSWNPSVSVSGPVVHVVWNDYRIGSEIWYKRDPTGSSIPLTLNLTALIEGFYDQVSNNMVNDTAGIYLRNNSAPYNIIDSSKGMLSSSGTGAYIFSNAVNSINYYLVIKHRNSIETWSKTAQQFTASALSYNFTTANSQAYGDNMKQADSSPLRFAIFSGDVNQDGFINLTDVVVIYNDAGNFVTGYKVTDVNGDNITDLSDVIIANNNSAGFVTVVRP